MAEFGSANSSRWERGRALQASHLADAALSDAVAASTSGTRLIAERSATDVGSSRASGGRGSSTQSRLAAISMRATSSSKVAESLPPTEGRSMTMAADGRLPVLVAIVDHRTSQVDYLLEPFPSYDSPRRKHNPLAELSPVLPMCRRTSYSRHPWCFRGSRWVFPAPL